MPGMTTQYPVHLTDTTPKDVHELREHPAVKAVYAGNSLRAAGAAHNVPMPTLAVWVRKVRKHFGDEGLPAKYLRMSAAATQKATFTYPIYDRVPGGTFAEASREEMKPVGEYATDLAVHQQAGHPPPFAMIVSGHSMNSPGEDYVLPDGAKVLCDPSLSPVLGDFVVLVDAADETLLVRRLVNRAALPDRDLWLEPLNGTYASTPHDNSRYQVAGTVVDALLPLYRKTQRGR